MEEPKGENRETRTALEQYRYLEQKILSQYPELIEDTIIETSAGKAPRNLRIFLPEGFMDVFVSGERYSFHWQSENRKIRFDNAPHHEELETHPEHIHIGEKIKNTPLKSGKISEKLIEAINYILEENQKIF